MMVKSITSKFLDPRNGNDVTLEAIGYLCILDQNKKLIFIVDPIPSCIDYFSLIAKEINNFLGDCIKDLLPLRAILSCNIDAIPETLDLLKISSDTSRQ